MKQNRCLSKSTEHYDQGLKHLAVVAIVAIVTLLLMVKTTYHQTVDAAVETKQDISGKAFVLETQKFWITDQETKIIRGNALKVLAVDEQQCTLQINNHQISLWKEGQYTLGSTTIVLKDIKQDKTVRSLQQVCVITLGEHSYGYVDKENVITENVVGKKDPLELQPSGVTSTTSSEKKFHQQN